MADTINKTKLQLRSGLSTNGDKTPSPATKLLISHGKPNFTIQRSPKVQQNGAESPLAQAQINNNNDSGFKNANGNGNINNNNTNTNSNGATNIVVQSTKFNGVFKPANISLPAEKQPHQQSTSDNEAARVVLRRAKASEPELREDEDASVPEFIRRQRRIQERLAKENVLDFENRRSGYFTHVLISPNATATASRTSFAETMSSPAVVPSLEIRPKKDDQQATTNGNGYAIAEEEEVAKAIEEVNKAIAGEPEDEEKLQDEEHLVHANVAVTSLEYLEEPQNNDVAQSDEVTISHTNGVEAEQSQTLQHASGALVSNDHNSKEFPDTVNVVQVTESTPVLGQGADTSSVPTDAHASGALVVNADTNEVVGANSMIQHASGALCVNYADASSEAKEIPETVKIVHVTEASVPELTNGVAPASIETTSHASGALIVNHEPKISEQDAELEAMSKMKFDIKEDSEQGVEVTSVLRTE